MLGSKFLSLAILGLASVAYADVVEYDWDITWVKANPDGKYERRVIGINGEFPCPPIEAEVGDTIRVRITNKLEDQTTGLHFHGIDQIGTPWADGPAGVTQCPVPPGESFTYEFLANAAGTYWYHSHDMAQYPDGLRGPLIVRDPDEPCKDQYDEEFVLTLSEWYHNESIPLVKSMLVPNNTQFRPPLGPDGMLVNDGVFNEYDVEPGKTYRLRIINIAAITSFFVEIPDRKMNVIMQDAGYVQEQAVDQLRISPAQRYDILITITDDDDGKNIPLTLAMDASPNYITRPNLLFIKQAYLVTDEDAEKPVTTLTPPELAPYDEIGFKPLDGLSAYTISRTIVLNFKFCRDANNLPRACFGEGANPPEYVGQLVPTLYTAASMGEHNTDPAIYGQVNPIFLDEDENVQIVINNLDPVAFHPFHFHGHQFQLVAKGLPGAGIWTEAVTSLVQPARKDTMIIAPGSFAAIRVTASQAAVFLLHCHIEWHVSMGLTVTFIQGAEKLRGLPIPEEHLAICKKQCIPTEGNAGGNLDPNDKTNFRTINDPNYIGAAYVPATCTPPKNDTDCKTKRRHRRGKRSVRLH